MPHLDSCLTYPASLSLEFLSDPWSLFLSTMRLGVEDLWAFETDPSPLSSGHLLVKLNYSLSFCSRYTFGKPVSGTLTINMTVNGVGYYSQEVGRPILRTTKVRSRNLELSSSRSLPTAPALGFGSVITHFILLSRTVCMVGIFLMIKFLQAEHRG